jgi:RimJ/RimL family protein N-acetyltransferase
MTASSWDRATFPGQQENLGQSCICGMDEGEHDETKGADREGRTTIATAISALRLVALTADDAEVYYQLVDCNRTHLTQHGDWTDLANATPESAQASLSDADDGNARFGIWLDGRLIGRADLNARTPGNVVLGYWLGREFTGKGYATAACHALIGYGKAELGVKNVYAGVTKGNAKSEALLARLGFHAVEDRGTYTLFRLPVI